jgi:hypothetical protein
MNVRKAAASVGVGAVLCLGLTMTSPVAANATVHPLSPSGVTNKSTGLYNSNLDWIAQLPSGDPVDIMSCYPPSFTEVDEHDGHRQGYVFNPDINVTSGIGC